MNVEISGVSPANRGALLMLEAIRAQIVDAFPGARIAVPLDWPAADRLRLGVWGTPGSMPRDLSLRLLDRAPRSLRERATFIRANDVDVLLDASGFGYGDFWGTHKLRRRLTDRLVAWKSDQKIAVLLPQALGPFRKPGMADAFRQAAERLDLLYVRDAASMAFVEEVLPQGSKAQRAPDFTNLIKVDLPQRLEHLRGASLIIPNEKMVAGKDDAAFELYIDFLANAVDAIRLAGREAMILLHEGRRDTRLAEALNARLDRPARVIDEPDPLVNKAVIGAAELIVSSRFHGLVSALSAGVPALACGWSHKYRELLEDYGCSDMLVDLERNHKPRDQVERFLHMVPDFTYRKMIAVHAEQEKAKSRAMWQEVLQLMGR